MPIPALCCTHRGGRLLRSCALALLMLLLAGWGAGVPGLAWASSLHGLRFSQLGTEDGLPSSAVTSLLQDRQGLVWIGSGNGLARYDGRHFKVWGADPEQSDMLRHGMIYSLLEDPENQAMWVGTRTGLDRIDLRDDSLRRIAMPEALSLQDRAVLGIAPAGSGQLWLALPHGLYRFDIASVRFERWHDPQWAAIAQDSQIRGLLADGQGGLWLTQGHQVGHIDRQGRLSQQLNTLRGSPAGKFSPVELHARSLAFDAEGRLWVGMAAGLQIWHIPADGRAPPEPDPLAEQLQPARGVVHAILRDQDGAMWLGSGRAPGLQRWQSGSRQLQSFYNLPGVPSSLAGNSIASLMQDRSGTLWVGTWGYGISLADLATRGFTSYLQVPGDERSLSNNAVMAMLQDGPEHVWLGTYGGGLNRLHLPSGDVERIPPQAVPLSHVKALLPGAPGRPGEIWAGGDGGLVIYEPKRGRSQALPLENTTPAGASISALLRDRSGQVWAGSAAGLHRFSPDLKHRVFRSAGGQAGSLSHDVVDSLLEDREGRIWIGSKGGLQLWDPQSDSFSQQVRANADMPAPGRLPIFGMREDAQGRIWLATEQGLYQLLATAQGWELKSWRQVPGMPAGEFSAIQDALNGEIWLSSEHGLTRFQPDRRQARFYPGRSRFGGGFSFASAGRGPDGSLYFGGPGLLRFQPEALRDNPTPPAVVLSDLLVLNRSLRPDAQAQSQPREDAPPRLADLGIQGPLHQASRVRLTHREAMVSFELAALQFHNRQQNRYAWRLEGFDRDWIYGIGDLGLAAYTNLDPGRYRLLARAANPDGVWSEDHLVLELEVLPPFWRSWWWRSGVVAVLLLALAAAYRWRVRVLHQTRLRLSELVDRRTHELLEQQQQLAREKQSAEAQREVAEKARRDIALLSEIGRQITASLDVGAIQQTLYRHVNELVDCSVFGLGLVDWQARVVTFDFVMQQGQPFQRYQRRLDEPGQPSVDCVLQARELNFGRLAHDARVLRADGATVERVRLLNGEEPQPALSGLYIPMMRQGQVMGVISVLSGRAEAFGPADLDILRTLGAYAAVALDNAEAYRRLKITQNQLVEQEKLAALGSLVAGVAHELNTPIGNSLLMASTLSDNSRRFLQQVQAGALRRSELERFCQTAEESSQLLVKSLGQAASLVTSFKQIAVDQTSDQRRVFDLATLCREVALTLGNRLRREEHELQLDVPEGLMLDSFPGPLGQVLTNLIINAMVHGLEGRKGGLMRLTGERLEGERLCLRFSDNGRGISEDNLGRIFDPFFTTRLGQGGSGLGLHISYNIVTATLGGSITARSRLGEGAQFEIVIPCVAPRGLGQID